MIKQKRFSGLPKSLRDYISGRDGLLDRIAGAEGEERKSLQNLKRQREFRIKSHLRAKLDHIETDLLWVQKWANRFSKMNDDEEILERIARDKKLRKSTSKHVTKIIRKMLLKRGRKAAGVLLERLPIECRFCHKEGLYEISLGLGGKIRVAPVSQDGVALAGLSEEEFSDYLSRMLPKTSEVRKKKG